MARCEVCSKDSEQSVEVHTGGRVRTFDSFECAIHRLARTREHCGCRVIGQGVQPGSRMFCCASCAKAAGVGRVRDHA